jgi:hypothetical protein
MPLNTEGRAGQRGHSVRDPFLAVQAALDQDARERILGWWQERNPARHGAAVADVLDMLSDVDAFLTVTEPCWEAHGSALAEQLGSSRRVVGPSALAATILLDFTDLDRTGSSSSEWAAPSEAVQLTKRIARAAAAGEKDAVPAPTA